MTPRRCRRILLTGFMGSGKSAVGREVARSLGWDFLDFDDAIREEAGAPIDTIFREHGEEHFRRLEKRVGKRLLRRERTVLASGGGWPAQPGHMDSLPEGTFSIWLDVSAEEAVRRVRDERREEPDSPVRPLLDLEDPLPEARRLLAARRPFYASAELILDAAAGAPSILAAEIVRTLKARSLL